MKRKAISKSKSKDHNSNICLILGRGNLQKDLQSNNKSKAPKTSIKKIKNKQLSEEEDNLKTFLANFTKDYRIYDKHINEIKDASILSEFMTLSSFLTNTNFNNYYFTFGGTNIMPIFWQIKLNSDNTTINNIDGDGNCLFRCLAAYLYNNENDFKKVKSSIFNFFNDNMILSNRIFIQFNFDAFYRKDFVKYLNDFKKAFWGGEFESLVFCYLNQVNIYFWNYDIDLLYDYFSKSDALGNINNSFDNCLRIRNSVVLDEGYTNLHILHCPISMRIPLINLYKLYTMNNHYCIIWLNEQDILFKSLIDNEVINKMSLAFNEHLSNIKEASFGVNINNVKESETEAEAVNKNNDLYQKFDKNEQKDDDLDKVDLNTTDLFSLLSNYINLKIYEDNDKYLVNDKVNVNLQKIYETIKIGYLFNSKYIKHNEQKHQKFNIFDFSVEVISDFSYLLKDIYYVIPNNNQINLIVSKYHIYSHFKELKSQLENKNNKFFILRKIDYKDT
jgi:hypothetical protein